MEEQTNTSPAQKSKTGSMVAIIGIIVIVAAVVIGYSSMKKSSTAGPAMTANTTNTQATNPTAEQTTTTSAPTEAMMKKSTYKDGTYSAIGNYTSPGGAETLGVSLTLANGVVKDATVEKKAFRPNSIEFQTEFADNFKPQVIGKSIDEIHLTKVSGSSLAPKGFNDAVDKIKAEAKS